MARARAVRIREPGDVDVLELGEIDVRDPGSGEIAVDVAAAGVNRADLLQRRGFYPPPLGFPPDVPGLEYAGTVASIGTGVTAHRVGDRVMGIIGGGGLATRVVVHEREAIRVPDRLSLSEAAAIPEVFFTAFDALFAWGELKLGETVLIHAVGSGVGTALLQLARAAGATTIGTSRTQGKLDRCQRLGLSHGVVPRAGAFAERVQELTANVGAHVVADPIGAGYLEENLRSLATRGRLVLYGSMGGISGELPIGVLMTRRARVMGTTLRTRPLEEKALLAQTFAREVLPLFAAGTVHPVIDTVMPMREIREAHRRMEQNDTFGKIVMSWE